MIGELQRIVEVRVVQFERKVTTVYGRDKDGQPIQEKVSRETGHSILNQLEKGPIHPEVAWSKDHPKGDEK